MMMRAFVVNNNTKKRNHFAAKIYPTLCYGDLERELDFPSCEISFCSPAGQPHHFAIPHCRRRTLHTHAAYACFLSTSSLCICSIQPHGFCNNHRPFFCELCVFPRGLSIRPNAEKWHPKPFMRITSTWPFVTAELHHMFMEMNQSHV